jgi:hypothetical protein
MEAELNHQLKRAGEAFLAWQKHVCHLSVVEWWNRHEDPKGRLVTGPQSIRENGEDAPS